VVTIPKDAKTGTAAQLHLKANWLECEAICVPGEAELDASIAINAEPGKPNAAAVPVAARFQSLKPRAWSELKGGTLRLENSTFDCTVEGAVQLEFYPGSKCSPAKDALNDGNAASPQLTMRLEGDDPKRVEGILAVYRTKQGPAEYYCVSDESVRKSPAPAPKTQPSSGNGAKEVTPTGR
jgi:hypothetical protein